MTDEARQALAPLRRQIANLKRQLRTEERKREPLLRWIDQLER